MGLDVNMYELVTDNHTIEKLLKEYTEMDFSYLDGDIFCLSKYEFGTLLYRDNKRVIDLFDKFKEYSVNHVLRDYFDLGYLTKKYGTRKDFIVECRERIDVEKYGITMDMRGDIDEDEPDNLNHDIFAIWTNIDGGSFVFKESEIPSVDIADELLFFKEVNYCRKTHKQSIYPSFIGDCWYEDNNSGLEEEDVRVLVYPNELDELKTHFDKKSPIQKWKMNDKQIVYLSA